MKKPVQRLIVGLICAAGIVVAVRHWPAPAGAPPSTAAKPVRRPPAPAAGKSPAVTRTTDADGRDLPLDERTLNDSGMVTIDERFVQPLPMPVFAPGRKTLSPFALVVLDLNEAESAAVVETFREAERDLHEEMNARARISPLMDGVRIAYRFTPEEIASREKLLRTRIAELIDPASQRYLQKIAPGALVATLLPVPLEDITLTITRNEKAEYRTEMVGHDSGGNEVTSWRVVRANALLTEFYGAQAREHLPQFNADLEALRIRRPASSIKGP